MIGTGQRGDPAMDRTRPSRTVLALMGRAALGRPVVVNLNANVTNLCTQSCPHCNAVTEGRARERQYMTLDELRSACTNLGTVCPPTISFSGGEPTVNPELPDMLDWAGRHCAFGVNLNTNLYGPEARTTRALDAALCVDARIDVSFDGFGAVADRLRGAKHVSDRVSEMMRWVTQRRAELGSRSVLTCHTVLNEKNLPQVFRILRFSEDLGWRQTLAPVNQFGYQDGDEETFQLRDSGLLWKALAAALQAPHLGQSSAFIRLIPAYLRGAAPKLCPYLSLPFRTYKVFLNPGGSASLCDRSISIGNLMQSSLSDLIRQEAYHKALTGARKCPGCWMICYVEPMIRSMPWKVWRSQSRLAA